MDFKPKSNTQVIDWIWFGHEDDSIRCAGYNSKPFSLFLSSRNLHFNVRSLHKHFQLSQNTNNQGLYVSFQRTFAYILLFDSVTSTWRFVYEGACFIEVKEFMGNYTENTCKAGALNQGFVLQKSGSFQVLPYPRDEGRQRRSFS